MTIDDHQFYDKTCVWQGFQLTLSKPNPQRFKALYLLILLLLTACQQGRPIVASPQPVPSPTILIEPSPATPSPSPTPQPVVPAAGGTAILGLIGRPESLNPITENNPALQELTPLLFESLLRVDPTTARLQPGLAQSWEYTPDGRQVIFHLPSSLRWSDGTPLTAAAIAKSLKATQHPALLAFSDITARDDETLVLTFAVIDCGAVTTLALLPLLPADQLSRPIPLGSGPFIVNDWANGKRTLSLVQNPAYHGRRPTLDGITVRFITRAEITVALSESQFDVVGPVQAPLPPLPDVALTDLVYPAAQVIYLAINFAPSNEPPVAPEVRQALVYALNRDMILSEVLGGDGQLLAGSLLPTHWAANNNLTMPAYDPETARALLTRAGLKDSDGDGWLDQQGQRLELAIRADGDNLLHQELAWLTSSYYRDLGLFAQAEGVPPDSLLDDLFTHDFNLAIFNWRILPDPDQRLYWRSNEDTKGVGLNFTSYNNAELDKLLDRGVTIPGCDLKARAEIYGQIQQTLVQDHPVDFLLAPNHHVLVSNRLHGLNPGPFVPLTWNASEWYVTDN